MGENKILIGIGGKKGSGKDTLATMIDYILTVGVSNAKFNDYFVKIKNANKVRIIAFADKPKELISEMFNIPINYFYDRDKKDSYYSIKTGKIYNKITADSNYKIVELDSLIKYGLSYFLRKYDNNTNPIGFNKTNKDFIVIKIRTLIQYVASEVFRKYIDENVWVNFANNKVNEILKENDFAIISDVRLPNESKYILNKLDTKNVIIKVVRDSIDNNDKHETEQNNFEYTHIIDNNGSKMHLFYGALQIVEQILK